MGLTYNASESSQLIQVLTQNLTQSQKQVTDLLAGSSHLQGCLTNGTLTGQAYEAAHTYFQSSVHPLLERTSAAHERLSVALSQYCQADRMVSHYGELDEDLLMFERARYQAGIEACKGAKDALSKSTLVVPLVMTAHDAQVAQEKAQLESHIREYEELLQETMTKLHLLRAFDSATRSCFQESAESYTTLSTDIQTTSYNNLSKDEKAFYDSLPEDVRSVVSPNDIVSTKDGFVMVTKPLSAIMEELGYPAVDLGTDENGKGGMQPADYWMDDHYIYGVVRDGKVVHGLAKMREEDGGYGTNGKTDGVGVQISFIRVDLNRLFSDPKGQLSEDSNFVSEFNRVTTDSGGKEKCDDTLVEYFSDTKSEGAYLVADLYVDKIIAENGGSNVYTTGAMKEKTKKIAICEERINQLRKRGYHTNELYGWETELAKLQSVPDYNYLESLNKKAGYQIFNPKTGEVTVKDPAHPTPEERQAILAIHTGNVTFSSFAAEVEFHADAVTDWKKNIPFGLGDLWYGHASQADMGVGEEGRSGNFDNYYNLEDPSVKNQEKAHEGHDHGTS